MKVSKPWITFSAVLAILTLSACGMDQPTDPGVSPSEGLLASRGPAQSCQAVQGAIVGNVLEASQVSGDLQGVTFNIAEPETTFVGGGVIRLATQHRFQLFSGAFAGGAFETVDRGMQVPVEGDLYRLINHYRIVRGEGPLEGASGNLQVNGTLRIDFENLGLFFAGLAPLAEGNGDIDVTYHGVICGQG